VNVAGEVTPGSPIVVIKTYTVTVNTPIPAGVTSIVNQLTTGTGTCVPCTVPIPTATADLVTTKTASPTSTTSVAEGSTVTYTLTFNNSGGTAPAVVDKTDDLTDVVDDANITTPPAQHGGTGLLVTSIVNGMFAISGTVSAGSTETVVYAVQVKSPDTGNRIMNNYLVDPSGGVVFTSCASSNPECTVNPIGTEALPFTGTPDLPTTVWGGLLIIIAGLALLVAGRRRGVRLLRANGWTRVRPNRAS
jgi:hypothetical protein